MTLKESQGRTKWKVDNTIRTTKHHSNIPFIEINEPTDNHQQNNDIMSHVPLFVHRGTSTCYITRHNITLHKILHVNMLHVTREHVTLTREHVTHEHVTHEMSHMNMSHTTM